MNYRILAREIVNNIIKQFSDRYTIDAVDEMFSQFKVELMILSIEQTLMNNPLFLVKKYPENE